MNKNILILTLMIFLGATKSYCHKKIQNNEIKFSHDARSVELSIKQFCGAPDQDHQEYPKKITAQLYKKVTVNTYDNTETDFFYLIMSIRAGRHATKYTADCLFNQGFKNGNFTFNKRPKKLNFAVKGSLYVDGVRFNNMVLAQGHTLFSNNWWFGGKPCKILNTKHHHVNAVNCRSADKKVTWCFLRGHVDNDIDGKHIKSTATNEVIIHKAPCNMS